MRRTLQLRHVCLLAWTLGCTSGARDAEANGASSPAHGKLERTVTLRFVNPTAHDLYVSVTDALPPALVGPGGALPRPDPCLATCDPCEPAACELPSARVRRVGPGQAFDVEWRGQRSVESACGLATGESTACTAALAAPPGAYRVELEARRARSPADGEAAGGALDVFEGVLEPASPRCVATGEITLGDAPATFELRFVCAQGS